jgi:hypothetical protein
LRSRAIPSRSGRTSYAKWPASAFVEALFKANPIASIKIGKFSFTDPQLRVLALCAKLLVALRADINTGVAEQPVRVLKVLRNIAIVRLSTVVGAIVKRCGFDA